MNRLLILLLISLLLPACASVPKGVVVSGAEKSQTTEKIVTERAKARWDALIAADYEKAYGFLSEGARGVTPVATYVLKRQSDPFKVVRAEVTAVICDSAEACNASVTLVIEMQLPSVGAKEVFATEEERWSLQSKQWNFVPK